MTKKLLLIGKNVAPHEYLSDQYISEKKNDGIDIYLLSSNEQYGQLESEELINDKINEHYDEVFIVAHGSTYYNRNYVYSLNITSSQGEEIDVVNFVKILKKRHNPKRIVLNSCYSALLIKRLRENLELRKELEGVEIICIGSLGREVLSYKGNGISIALIKNPNSDLTVSSLEYGTTIKSIKIGEQGKILEEQVYECHKHTLIVEYLMYKSHLENNYSDSLNMSKDDLEEHVKSFEDKFIKPRRTETDELSKSFVKSYDQIKDSNFTTKKLLNSTIFNGLVEAIMLREEENVEKYINLCGLIGLDISTQFIENDTTLAFAICFGTTAIVKKLLDSGVNVNSKNRFGMTPFAAAIDKGDYKIVRMLLDHEEIDVNLKDDLLRLTPLMRAINKGDPEIVRMLLDCEETDVNSKGICGVTPLMMAIDKDDPEIVRMLLDCEKIDVNLKVFGFTPLISAIDKGNPNPKIIKMLLGHNDIDVNLIGGEGKKAISYALEKDMTDVIKLLMNATKKNTNTEVIKKAKAINKKLRLQEASVSVKPNSSISKPSALPAKRNNKNQKNYN